MRQPVPLNYTVPALWREACVDGAAPAVIYTDRAFSYAELDGWVEALVVALARLGLETGDRLAMWMPNTPAYVALYLACARLGVVVVAVNTRFRSVEVADIIARSRAVALVLWPAFRNIDFLAILNEIPARSLAGLRHVVSYDEDDGSSEDPLPVTLAHCERHGYRDLLKTGADAASGLPLMADEDHIDPDLPCNIFTTSGTTRAPKFVLHTQRSIVAHARDLASAFAPVIGEGGLLQALPLCGVFGFTQVMLAIAARRPMILMSAFDAAAAVAAIDAHQVSFTNATDDMIASLLNSDSRPHALPSVRVCGFAAFNQPPEETVARADERGVNLVGLYGMSEVQALFAFQDPHAPAAQRMLGGGRLVGAQASVRVRNLDTGELCGLGEPGELEISGPSLMLEYDGDSEATRAALGADGFLRTGDLGYLTAADAFVYLNRLGDALRLGGFLVSPAEIEEHILAAGASEACQVVSVERDGRQVAVGFVIPKPGVAFDEVAAREHCRQGLARFKVPARIFALDEFPTTKSANGIKIQRSELRDMAMAYLQSGDGD